MYKILYLFRYTSFLAIICSLLGSFLMFIIGASKTYYAFNAFITGGSSKESLSHLRSADIATTYLIKSIDAFLIAFALFIFARGVYSLFISNKPEPGENQTIDWIKAPGIGHLKNVLGEVIVIILFVKFLELALVSLGALDWIILVLPVSIILLSVSLKFLGLKHESDNQKSDESSSS